MSAEEQIQEKLDFSEHIVHLGRVAKVVKGGRRFSFAALVVIGNGEGLVGYGLGKAQEVPEAIRKGSERARKNMIMVPVIDGTVPHEVIGTGRQGSDSPPVPASSPAVQAAPAAGVGTSTRCGTRNPHNVATVAALRGLFHRRPLRPYGRTA